MAPRRVLPTFSVLSQHSPVVRGSFWTCSRSAARSARWAPTLWAPASPLTSGTAFRRGSPTRGWTQMTRTSSQTAPGRLRFRSLVDPSSAWVINGPGFHLSSSTWTPKGDYISSNTDECTATLFYAVNLKTPGIVSFEYVYPDEGIYFEFFVSALKGLDLNVGDLWRPLADSSLCHAGSKRPVPVYRLGEPLDEDLWNQVEQVSGLFKLGFIIPVPSYWLRTPDPNHPCSLRRQSWRLATTCCTGGPRATSWLAVKSNLLCSETSASQVNYRLCLIGPILKVSYFPIWWLSGCLVGFS